MRLSTPSVRSLATVLTVLAATDTAVRAGEAVIDLGRGPVVVHIPSSYDPSVPAPLLLLLHGYSATGAVQEAYMQFAPVAEKRGILYLHPDGTADLSGNQFWNATDACCDFWNTGVDDSGYLRALIDEVRAQFNVDARRIYLVGHSNGGFMSYRMACDHADVIAAVASLAGATWLDPNQCNPSAPVHVAQIHGTADTTIFYNGGCTTACYPGAIATVEQWAVHDGCDLTATPGEPLDLVLNLPGAETEVMRYDTGCLPGGSAELWTIPGGVHVPVLSPVFAEVVTDFLLEHPKPCATDLDGDNTVGILDLLALLAAWGSDPGGPPDFDGDGSVGILDLLTLLANWGPCL